MTANPITNELAAARAEVSALRARAAQIASDLKVAEARLGAFEIAAKAFEDAAPKLKAKGSKRTRNRLPTDDWQRVFQTLHAGWNNAFGYDEVMQAAVLCGLDGVKKPSLRTKMMNYVEGGYVERKDAGRFSISPQGIPYFKIEGQSSTQNEPRSVTAGGSDHGQGEVRTFPRPWESTPTVQG